MEICIIKLGAKGDVVRTTPILESLHKKYPSSKITWVTKESSRPILEGNPLIKNLLTIPFKTDKLFDLLINLDIDKEATSLSESISAKSKLGFKEEEGYTSAYNLGAEYYLNTIFDDEIKKTNNKTYQEMMFEAAELEYQREKIQIYLDNESTSYAEEYSRENALDKSKLIGIHMGSSPRWPSKAWHPSNVEDFIELASKEGYQIILFGGPDEAVSYPQLKKRLISKGVKFFTNNVSNTDKQFISLVRLCSQMVCSDSYSLHVSLGLEKPTIGLFFCTSPNEVEGYGLLTKIISGKLYEFFPEKMDQYDEELVKSILPTQVLEKIKNKNKEI